MGSGSPKKNPFNKQAGSGLLVFARGSGPSMEKLGPNLTHCHSYLKLGLDRTVRPEKSRTAHFVVFLALRTALWEKSKDLCELRSDLTILRTVIKPLLMVSYFPLNLNLKK